MPEQQTKKARKQGTIGNNYFDTAHVFWKVLM